MTKPTPVQLPRALSQLLWWLVYLLPAVLFFSYYPIISLGANASMNFELSLPLIWLVLFDAVAFIAMFFLPKPKPVKALFAPNFPGISDRRIFLFSLFPFFATLSVFWSANPLRGLLTAGIIWLLFFAVFAIIFLLPLFEHPARLKTNLLLSLFISTAAVCLFCFLQSILDTCGFPRDITLLCAGCTYRSFGFPHPSGFAIEPQFMGNLLLAPTLTALYLLVFRYQVTSNPPTRSSKLLLILAAGLFSTTLFFTLSRGAIYAYAAALLVLFIFALIKKSSRWSLIVIPAATFLLSLGLQGTFAALGPTSETFSTAITKSIHQLSLGLIDLRPLATAQEPAGTSEAPVPETPAESSPVVSETPYFSGYVAESTNARLGLNSAALSTWLSAPGHPESGLIIGLQCQHSDPCTASARLTPTSLLFGVGLGGAGTALHANQPITGITTPKEIVQNQFFSLLLETGLVGLALAAFGLFLALFAPLLPQKFTDGRAAPQSTTPPFWSHPALPLLAALIIAYLLSLNFFSGLPNALHIYLMPPLLFFLFQPPAKIAENPCHSCQTAL